jgi:hypothetical protein
MTESEPQLAPPGAGIPIYQKLVLRLYVNPFLAGKGRLEDMRSRFIRKHQRISEAYLAIPEELRERKVLVPPLMGLEDSSRFWSAAMVLEHVQIVGSAMGEGIVKLSNEEDPGFKPDTAKVKPKGILSAPEIFAAFETWRHGFLNSLDARVRNMDSKRTLAHPWFGPFTARKWYWLLPVHADIHLKQLRAIQAGLGVSAKKTV